jgi:hypothetical protein
MSQSKKTPFITNERCQKIPDYLSRTVTGAVRVFTIIFPHSIVGIAQQSL